MTARANLQQLPITGVVHGPQQVRCARGGLVGDTDRCLACPDLHALVIGDGDGRSWVLCGGGDAHVACDDRATPLARCVAPPDR